MGSKSQQSKNNLVIRHEENLSEEAIYQWLMDLRGRPFVDQSNFDVTSVFKVQTESGQIFFVGGVNVENTELTVGTCGEEGAIAAAVGAHGQKIELIEGWVMGAPRGATEGANMPCTPCGECRQRIAQYTAPEAPIHMIGLDGTLLDTKTRDELLPYAFSFRDLEHNGQAAAAPQLAHVGNPTHRLMREPGRELSEKEIFTWLNGLQPDVRVSEFAEAVVLKLENGAYVAGVKVENAAYPSSTSAMQAAAAVMNAGFGPGHQVTEVWSYGRYNAPDKAAAMEGTHHPLSGTALQVLKQFASENVEVHMFNSQGEMKEVTLDDALLHCRTFHNPHPPVELNTSYRDRIVAQTGGASKSR